MVENFKNNTSLPAASEEEAALTSVRKTLFKYLTHFHYFLFFIAVALGGAYLYLRYTLPQFKASGTVLLSKEDKAGADKDLIDVLVSGKPSVNVQDEIELIRSRYLLNKVVAQNKWNVEIWTRGVIRTSEIFRQLPFTVHFDKPGDSVKNTSFSLHFLSDGKFRVNEGEAVYTYNNSFVVSNETFKILPNLPIRPADNSLYDIFIYDVRTTSDNIAKQLKITPKSNMSSVVELTFTGSNKDKDEVVLQKIMEAYVQLGVDEKKKVQQNTLSFINERLSVLSGELGSVEGQLESFKRENNVIDITGQSEQYIGDVAEQAKDLSRLMVQKQMIEYLLQYLGNRDNLFNLTPTNLGIEDPVLLSLAQDYNRLILEREKELTINTNISPVIKNLDATIEKARYSILENLKSIRSGNAQAIARLSNERNKIQSQISRVPGKERQLGGIMRQEKIKNDLFSYLLQKREETEISLAGAVPEAKIFNSSMVGSMPISPNRRSVWVIAMVIGIAIPLLIIWIKDLLNNKVNTRTDITQALQAPLLGEIGHNNNNNVESIVVKPASRKVIGEQFRNIRSNINFLVPPKKSFCILTTSTNAGEGKSFTSINLAATYAIAGKKTILIEMDLRKPKLARYLNITSNSGITDYLIGKSPLSTLVKNIPGYENLFLLDAGAIPPNPAELMMSTQMQLLFAELKEGYDVIIFDCPPVGLVSDAQIISPQMDLSIYVIRQRVTLKSQLTFIDELYQSKRLNNLGIIVNDVKVEGYYGYYGNGSYSYGGYYGNDSGANGDGYFEREPAEKGWFKKLVNKS
jgi:capsular exopolysaccharide synthesis family protein